MEALAARLLSIEVIEEEELRRILGPKVAAPRPLLSQTQAEGEGESHNPEAGASS